MGTVLLVVVAAGLMACVTNWLWGHWAPSIDEELSQESAQRFEQKMASTLTPKENIATATRVQLSGSIAANSALRSALERGGVTYADRQQINGILGAEATTRDQTEASAALTAAAK